MRTTLFREDAVLSKAQRQYGSPLTSAGIKAKHWAICTGLLLAVAMTYACAFSYTRKQPVKGEIVVPMGTTPVYTPKAGVVRRVYVSEGQAVRKGEPLFLLVPALSAEETRILDNTISKTRQQIASYQEEIRKVGELEGIQVQSLQEKVAGTRTQLNELNSQAAYVEMTVKKLKGRVAVYEKHRGFFSEEAINEKRMELLREMRTLSDLRYRIADLTTAAQLATRQIEAEKTGAAQKLEQLRRNLSIEERALREAEEQRQVTLLANSDGVVDLLAAREGHGTQAGQVIANIVPKEVQYEARLTVPPRAVGHIRAGQSVTLRYDAYPVETYGSYKGTVTAISEAPVIQGAGKERGTSEPAYRVSVALASQTVNVKGLPVRLRPGATLSADIALENRSLVEWLFAPILALKGRL